MNRKLRFISKITSITLVMAMVLSCTTAFAAGNNTNLSKNSINSEEASVEVNNVIPVKDANGLTVQYLDGSKVRSQSGCKEFVNNMSSGWYVLSGEKVTNDAVVIQGKVNLILADNSYLEAKNGIYITKDSELVLWAQSRDAFGAAGRIVARPENGPGIGAVRDTMGGSLTVNGGVIDAQGGKYAAGIGGGRGENSGFGNITINEGYVYAKGGDCAAGIGRGQRNWNMGTVTINGGEVIASCANDWGAGIGGSEDRSGTTVIINGGKVTATGGHRAAGIGGGGDGHQGGKITINGGEVNAKGGYYAAAIGGGANCSGSSKAFNGGEIEINGGTVNATNIGSGGAALGGGQSGKNGPITINGGTVKAEVLHKEDSAPGCAIGSCQYKDQGDAITINGGEVTAICAGKSAAIGGGRNGGVVNINGGVVNAIAARGAGIGAGEQGLGESTNGGNGGNVTITGGKVTAVSNGKSAGIGGGIKGSGGTVTITGGEVMASGSSADNALLLKTSNYGAGAATAGSAANGSASAGLTLGVSLLVYLFTQGDVGGAGIGGGYKGNGANVKITGGTVVATAKQKGCSAIGKGLKGDNDGSLEIYDEAMVKAGDDAKSVSVVKADDRGSACRNNRNAVIEKCSHADCQYKDKNVKLHDVTCSYCKSSAKALEHEHVFDNTTHKCACGRMQYKATIRVSNTSAKSDALENVLMDTSNYKGRSLNRNSVYDITQGDTIKITSKNKGLVQNISATYSENGVDKTYSPKEYKTESDGTVTYIYAMPNKDINISIDIRNQPVELKTPEVTNSPSVIKGVVYDGTRHMIVEPGACRGGTLFYALGKDDVNPPAFDGDIYDTYGSRDNDRTWKHSVPTVVEAGTYNVWYMVKGEEGYTDSKPAVVQGEIRKVDSVKGKEKTTKGEVRDITDFRRGPIPKKQCKMTIDVSNNAYKGDVKFDLEIDGKKIESPKEGDVLDVVEGDIIKVDIPADVDAKKGVQLFYKKRDNVTYTATPKVNKLNEDGSLHAEFEAPGYDSRIVIQLDGSGTQAKRITYEAPTPRSGLVYNGKGQALVRAGSAKGGKMYYALGENATTAPAFDGLSEDDNKVWGIGVPKASEPGKYYVWYMVKGDEGYEDVSPKCVEAEIGKSAEQKKESAGEDIDEEENVTPVKASSDNKLPEAIDITEDEKDKGVNVWLEVDDITDSMDDYSKMVLYNRFSDYEIPIIYDLSMYMKVGDEEPIDIVDLQEELELTLDVPARYAKEGRSYIIIRFNSDDPSDITVINPIEFDAIHNELTFSTDKICPIAIAYKADEDVVNREATTTNKIPSLISPRAKEGLYYSGQDMELVIPGNVVGGTIYYALSKDSNEAPEFDGLSDDKNKTWNTSIPTGKKVGSYNVWYKVVGDKGYSDLDGGCVVSEIKEVPKSKYNNVDKEKGKITNITDHPDVSDNNPNKVKIEGETKPPVPAKIVDDNDDSDYQDDEDIDDIIDYNDEGEGINYWLELDDITDELTDDDVWTIYQQLRKYYVGSLIDFSLVMQQGDELFDITELDEPITISFEIPDYLRNPGRRYIIYMLEDDGDFYEPEVIRPEGVDETNNRITFKTDRIKPFIIGYTDDLNEGDVIVPDENYDSLRLLSDVIGNNDTVNKRIVNTTGNAKPDTTPTIEQQSNIKQPDADNSNVVKADNYQISGGTTIKIPSAKTNDGFCIFNFVFNLIHNMSCDSGVILAVLS